MIAKVESNRVANTGNLVPRIEKQGRRERKTKRVSLNQNQSRGQCSDICRRSRLPNKTIPLSRQTSLGPFNPVPLADLADNSRGPSSHNTPAGHHHTRRHNGAVKHDGKILDNSHTPDTSPSPNMDMIPQGRGLDNRRLANKDMVTDLEWVKRVHTTV